MSLKQWWKISKQALVEGTAPATEETEVVGGLGAGVEVVMAVCLSAHNKVLNPGPLGDPPTPAPGKATHP